jgi:hypothetical protein
MFVPSLQNILFLSTDLPQKRGDFASDYGDTVHRQMDAHIDYADLPTAVSLSSAVVIVMRNAYLEELHQTHILYYFNTGNYDWIVSTKNP